MPDTDKITRRQLEPTPVQGYTGDGGPLVHHSIPIPNVGTPPIVQDNPPANWIEAIGRLLLGGGDQPTVSPNQPPQPGITDQPQLDIPDDVAEFIQMMHMQNANQPGPAYQQFQDLATNYPQREDPGILQKIGAAMAGVAGGPQAAQDYLYAPYNRQVEDWKNRVGTLGTAATLESNFGQRQFANELARAKYELDRYQTMNPDARLFSIDGRIIGVNPQTGQSEDLGQFGLTPQQESDLDLESATNEAEMRDKIAQRKEARENVESDRQSRRDALEALEQEEAEIKGRIEVKQTPSGDVDDPKTMSQLELRRWRDNKAQELIQLNPDMKKYIDYVNQEFRGVKPVGTGFGKKDLSENLRNDILRQLGYEVPDIIMLTKDGKRGSVSPEEVDRLKELGYTVEN